MAVLCLCTADIVARVYIYTTARSLNAHLISNVQNLIVSLCNIDVTRNKTAYLEKMKKAAQNLDVKGSFGVPQINAASHSEMSVMASYIVH